MPITVDPIDATVTKTVEQTIKADRLNVDKLDVDGSDPSKPTVDVVLRPYAVTDAGPVFGDAIPPFATKNLFAAAVNVPELGAAMLGVFVGIQAWHVYALARQAEYAQAATSVTQLTTQVAALLEARHQAFATRTSETDPLWTTADAAWQQATAALATATTNATTARLAAEDPANPRLA